MWPRQPQAEPMMAGQMMPQGVAVATAPMAMYGAPMYGGPIMAGMQPGMMPHGTVMTPQGEGRGGGMTPQGWVCEGVGHEHKVCVRG